MVLARDDHVGLEHDVFQNDAMPVQCVEHRVQHRFGNFIAAFDAVIAVDEHLRLDDGDDAFCLTYRSVTGQHFRVGLDAERRRIAVGDAVDLAPLGKAHALRFVSLEALGQAIQSLGDQIARRAGKGCRALVHLDTGHDASAGQDLRQRRAVLGVLSERFLEQNHSAQELFGAGGRYQQRPVGAAGFVGAIDADSLEPLADGRQALVRRENALAGLRHIGDRRLEFVFWLHESIPLLGYRSSNPAVPESAFPRSGANGDGMT